MDLIDRKAAIDALTLYIHNMDRVIGTGKLSMDDCRDAAESVIEDLPSAQPDLQPTCNQLATDCISRQAVKEWLKRWDGYIDQDTIARMQYRVMDIPSAQPEQRWIPIKWHDCTDEDREKYGFSKDVVAVFDCEMPDDEQEILVTSSHGYVEKDVCYIDDGYSLDSGWDWIEDIKAWMPLPEPYREGENS